MEAWSGAYSMCNNQNESPIDIDTEAVRYDGDQCSAEFEWDVEFEHETFSVKNNGHSLSLTAVETTTLSLKTDGVFALNDGTKYFTVNYADDTIAKFPNYFQPKGSKHTDFCLAGFHFHWGQDSESGSEHLVNGHQYPLEIHFVHYSCEHAHIGVTLDQFPDEASVNNVKAEGDAYQLGVVGFFYEISEEDNPAFDAILNATIMEHVNLPAEPANASFTGLNIVKHLNLTALIPADYASAGYYAYEGSLTTPPCTDIVRWHVMNAKGSISESQMERFRGLMSTAEHHIAPNFREVQSNSNPVYACMGAPEVADVALERTIIWMYAVFTFLLPFGMGAICLWQAKREKVVVNVQATSSDKHQDKH